MKKSLIQQPAVEQDLPIRKDPGGIISTQGVYFCNEDRFTAAYFSEGLTAYGLGWRDPENLQEILDNIAPPVPAPRRFAFKAMTNAEAFLTEQDDLRGIGSEFKRVEHTGEEVDGSTRNHGLMMILDEDEPLMTEEQAVGYLRQRLIRNRLRGAVTIIDAAASNTNKTWNAASDPDQDIEDDLDAGGDARGMESDTVVIGISAWRTRKRAYRGQNNAGGYASVQLGPQALADTLMVDRVVPVRARFQSSAAAKSKIISNAVYHYAAPKGITRDDPSNVKRFVTQTRSGGPIAVHRWEMGPKRVAVAVEQYERIYVTSTLGIRKITVSS